MITRLFPFTLTLLLLSGLLAAQPKLDRISASYFHNVPSLPHRYFSGNFMQPLHSGFTAGTGFDWKRKNAHLFHQTFKAGYFYHRQAHHAIQLFTEVGDQYHLTEAFSLSGRFGVGYMHLIPDNQRFVQKDNGDYTQKQGLGRPQGMASLTLDAGYRRLLAGQDIRLSLDYQWWLQFPFVRQYVPVLPNTAMHIGLTWYLPKKKEEQP